MDDERINPFIRVDINSEPKNMDENGSTGCVSNNQQVQKQDQQSYPSQTMTVGYVHPQPMALYPLAPEVKTHQRTESDISGKESSVFIDYKEKKIFFIKQHTRTDNNYVQTNYCEYFTGSKSTKKRSIIQIADGVFSILRISSDEMNNKTISIKVNDIDEELVITLSDVVTCSNTVLRKFGEKGLLIKPKYKTPICEYIFNVAKNLEVNEKHMGFYYDRNGTLAHDNLSIGM